jgi:hypothetical protein
VKEYYDKYLIVFLHEDQVYGDVESLGTYASIVKYTKDGIDYEELIENSDFTIMDEFVISHVEED